MPVPRPGLDAKRDINTPQRQAEGPEGGIEPVDHAYDAVSRQIHVDVVLGELDVAEHGRVVAIEDPPQLVTGHVQLWVEVPRVEC